MTSKQQKYVLAMYDVRGKQEYIFRSNKIKEIVGGSCIIRDCFEDYLYPAAKQYRNQRIEQDLKRGKTFHSDMEQLKDCDAIYVYDSKKITNDSEYDDTKKMSDDEKEEHGFFSLNKFRERMASEVYLGEVIYNGGGNFLVLYKDTDTCIGINKIFTKWLMEKTATLKVLCTYIEVDSNLSNYEADNKELYRIHSINEAQESVVRAVNTLPFVQVDRMTSMPLTDMIYQNEEYVKVSKESFAKLKKYAKVSKLHANEYGEKILDNLVKEKGVDSQLAVIFIDGNNMGAKVQECCNNVGKDYESRVNALRKFSKNIQKNYIDDRIEAINAKLNNKYDKEGENKNRRFIVYAGDEMNFICRAEDAYGLVEAYFAGLPKGCSACAGIAIFNSHAPYAEAYRIAEECCETGKKNMKDNQETDTCYLDFQYCQGGLGNELEDIRKREVGEMRSKPWLIKDNGMAGQTCKKERTDTEAEDTEDREDKINEKHQKSAVPMEQVIKVFQALKKIDGRTNLKRLAQRAKQSLEDFDMEMNRIYAHQKQEVQEEIKSVFKELKGEERRNLIYDIAIIYDQWEIWFSTEENNHQDREGGETKV